MTSTQRDELVAALTDAGAQMNDLLTQVGDARLAEPGVSEAWSVKDILAHITAWEERIVAWVDALTVGGTPTPAGWSDDWSEEKVNEWIFESNQPRTATEIVTRWREVHQSVLDAARTLDDELLFNRSIEWLGGNILADAMPGNSYEHLNEHAQAIRTWLATRTEG